MGMAAPHFVTPDMARALPDDGNHYETVHGELLVTPAPSFRHQNIVLALARALDDYCRLISVGNVVTPTAEVSLTPDSLVQPDVFVVPPVRDPDPAWADLGRPLLIVEILSPSTAPTDRFTKRLHYQRARIPAYWIVDGEEREVAVWAPEALEPVIEREMLTWQPIPSVPPLRLPVKQLFR